MNLNPTPIVPSASVTFRGKKYPVRMTAKVLLELKQRGINLMDSGPTDPKSLEFYFADQALQDAVKRELPQSDIDSLRAIRDAAWEATPPERKTWKHPLDRATPIEQMELGFIIGALAISTPKEQITEMDIAGELDITQGLEFATLMYNEVQKFLAPLVGPPAGVETSASA